ncbi:MAG TPA: glycosyltransferase family 2 protein [Chitinophagaceae bacterium]|nr:glycosyltransferase family 2 protein [Chitinophagaceae bacterium]
MRRVYIIILNYKKWKDAQECIESVFRSSYTNYSVIVIDNYSENESLEHLMNGVAHGALSIPYKYFHIKEFIDNVDIAVLPNLVFIQNDSNKGFAGGINIVLKKLLNEDAYIWLLNPDMVVAETTLSALACFAEKNSSRSIIGSVIKYHDAPEKVHLYAGGRINFNSATVQLIDRESDIGKLDYISGGSLFTGTHSFNDIGLLPDNYFLYWEETDWCYRAKKAGYKLCVCETAICYDKVSTTIGKSFLADYYYTRNGLLFLSKYKKSKVPVALFFVILRCIKRVMTGEFKRAWGVYKGMVSFLKKEKNENK